MTDTLDGFDLMRQFLPASQYVRHLGIAGEGLEPDHATLRLPFADHVITIGETVHGGAIASLIDTAAMAASWATPEAPASMRGTTVGLAVNFLRAANKTDVVARARVARRGKSLCFVEVDAVDGSDERVAQALVTYKLG